MKLKVKNMDIATGGILVALINKYDAEILDLHAMDRIKLRIGRKIETAIVDIGSNGGMIKKGSIGLFTELSDSLKAKDGDDIKVTIARKPLSLEYIRKKLDGITLNKEEIDQIVWDIVNNKLTDIELTYFVAAGYTNVMSLKETVLLTKAMAEHGDILKIDDYPVVDKHCVGGVPGNRTTMIVVPIIAAAGLKIPKTSSRSITSPAGTGDTMEVIADVAIPIKKMKAIVEKHNGCIVWGGSLNLAPADDKIIRVERPLSIDAESQLIASIMAKKHSVSSTHILIDIPYGKGSKVPSKAEALNLKERFEQIGMALKKEVKVILTDGTQPIGNGIGPSLEARDVLWLLKNDIRAPQDLKSKSVLMAGYLLEMAKKAKPGFGAKKALEIVESGIAYEKFIDILKAQGARVTDPEKVEIAQFSIPIKSDRAGRITAIDNMGITHIARVAGAPQEPKAGLYLHVHKGTRVKKGDILFTLYANNKEKLKHAIDEIKTSNPITIK